MIKTAAPVPATSAARTAQNFQLSVLPELPAGFAIQDTRLFYKGLDIATLANPDSATYVRHLPSLRANVAQLQSWFNASSRRTNYAGSLTIAFASKANPSEPVVRTLLQAGTAYECSSAYDIAIARHALDHGWIDSTRRIFVNGFKIPSYAQAAIALRAETDLPVTPIFDDPDEVLPFAASGLWFDVGVRFRTDAYGDEVNRFGMTLEELSDIADRILLTDTLRLTTFHAMQAIPASQGGPAYWESIANSIRAYARLRRISPALNQFDIGGGLPARTSGIDQGEWLTRLLHTMITVCRQEFVPVPNLIIESGRYLVQDHAFRLFHVLRRRNAADGIPYYLIDGSIMSTFPDAWALGDKFTVLPITGWNGSFGAARLSGLTCDHDDVYPTHRMADQTLALPNSIDGLLIGFFDCGAYQETIGGRGGAKHCILPEAPEIVLDELPDGQIGRVETHSAQNALQVLTNLGYTLQYSDPG